MDVALILNRRSRRGAAERERVLQLLGERGVHVKLDLDPQSFPSLKHCGMRARESGLPRVIVAGGDGTVSGVIRCFAHTEIEVAILPLGTGNALARDLALPKELNGCCDVAAGNHVRSIDLGYAAGDNFVNVVTVGVSTLIARELNPSAKRVLGKVAYFAAVLRAYRQAKPFAAKLTLDGHMHEFTTLQVVIGNGRFHAGPFPLSASASLTDDRLTVYALQSGDRRKLVELAKRLVMQSHQEMPDLLLAEVTSGRLETTPDRAVTMDGERGIRTPFDFRIDARALRVLVPEETASGGLETPQAKV